MLTSTQNNTSHLLRVMMSFSSGASLLFPSNYQWAEIAWFCPGRGFVNAGTSAGNQVIRWRRNPSRLSNISWLLRHKPQRKITQHHKETAAWDVSLFTLTTSTWCFVHPLDVRGKCASVRLLFFLRVSHCASADPHKDCCDIWDAFIKTIQQCTSNRLKHLSNHTATC